MCEEKNLEIKLKNELICNLKLIVWIYNLKKSRKIRKSGQYFVKN